MLLCARRAFAISNPDGSTRTYALGETIGAEHLNHWYAQANSQHANDPEPGHAAAERSKMYDAWAGRHVHPLEERPVAEDQGVADSTGGGSTGDGGVPTQPQDTGDGGAPTQPQDTGDGGAQQGEIPSITPAAQDGRPSGKSGGNKKR